MQCLQVFLRQLFVLWHWRHFSQKEKSLLDFEVFFLLKKKMDKSNLYGEFYMRWMFMGVYNKCIYMWLLINLNFGISWGIISVVKATDSHAEGHLLHSCILQHIIIGMKIYPYLFASRAGEDLGCQWSTQTIKIFLDNK